MGDHFGPIWHISVNRDGTSPKLLWYIALVIIYKPTKFLVETHRVAGLAGPTGAVRARPAEPWARDLRTAGAVRVRHADHWGRVRATCGPQKPCARDMRTAGAMRVQPADH